MKLSLKSSWLVFFLNFHQQQIYFHELFSSNVLICLISHGGLEWSRDLKCNQPAVENISHGNQWINVWSYIWSLFLKYFWSRMIYFYTCLVFHQPLDNLLCSSVSAVHNFCSIIFSRTSEIQKILLFSYDFLMNHIFLCRYFHVKLILKINT